jgi:hypothetical protein
MSIQIVSPRVGWCRQVMLRQWLAEDGDWLSVGQPICLLQTEHGLVPLIPLRDGFFHARRPLIPPDTRLDWGTPLGFLRFPGADPSTSPYVLPPAPRRRPCRVSGPHLPVSERPARPERGPRTSPRARRLARARGVDLSSLTGTGTAGRIRERDVQQVLPKSRIPLPPFPAAAPAPTRGAVPVDQQYRLEGTFELRRAEAPRGEEPPSSSAPQPAPPSPGVHGLDRLLLAVARARLRTSWPKATKTTGRTERATLALHLVLGLDPSGELQELVLELPTGREELSLVRVQQELRRAWGQVGAQSNDSADFSVVDLAGWPVDVFLPPIASDRIGALAVGAPQQQVVPVAGKLHLRWTRRLILITQSTRLKFLPSLQFFQAIQTALHDDTSRI